MRSELLVPTEDGSLSLIDAETGEWHHNRAGAYKEALENYFLPSGAVEIMTQTGVLNIFDACYGLGYNSLVTLAELAKSRCSGTVFISGVDIDPRVFGYSQAVMSDNRLHALQEALAGKDLGRPGAIEFKLHYLQVSLQLIAGDLRDVLRETNESGNFHLVFHDPFSWRKVPELWTFELFSCYFRLLSPILGRLLTYSLATPVRAAMLKAGFSLYRTMGVGRKKGGTLACVDENTVQAGPLVCKLSAEELARLTAPASVPFSDPGLQGLREDIRNQRLYRMKSLGVDPQPD